MSEFKAVIKLMKKLFKILLVVIVIAGVIGFFYKDAILEALEKENGQQEEPTKVSRGISQPKEVEVLIPLKDDVNITFSKNGSLSSTNKVNISPQISGRITDINVSLGDNVREGQIVAELGDSLNTDILNFQEEAAHSTLYITRQIEDLTDKIGRQSIEGAKISSQILWETYQSAIVAKNNSIDIYEQQREISEDQIDDLEDALDDAEDLEEDLEDDLKKAKRNFRNNPSQENKLIVQALETQLDQTEEAVEALEDQLYLAEDNLEIADLSFESQLDQFNTNIDTAYLQYEASLAQQKSAITSSQIQSLQIDGQIVQAENNLNITWANYAETEVKSPINGVVTKVIGETGNLTSPGQTLLVVEDLEKLQVTLQLTEQEASLVETGDRVVIKNNSEQIRGRVIEKAQSLDQQTKKLEITIEVTESNSNVTPGSFTDVVFQANTNNLVFIPLNSIFIDNDHKKVRIVNTDNEVEIVEVEIGQIIGKYVQIINGLDGNEKVITTVKSFLNEGEKVIYE